MKKTAVALLVTATVVGIAVNISPVVASASPIPAILTNVGCDGGDGQPMDVKGPYHAMYECRFSVEPSTWTPTNDGSFVLSGIHWSSWGVVPGDRHSYSRLPLMLGELRQVHDIYPVTVSFSFPVTWDGHLVYAQYDVYPNNQAQAKILPRVASRCDHRH